MHDLFPERYSFVTHLYEDHNLELAEILNYMGKDEPISQLEILTRLHRLFSCKYNVNEAVTEISREHDDNLK